MSTATTSMPLTAGRWAVDVAHTSAGFTIRHLGVSTVRGRFNAFSADVIVGEDLASTSVDASVALDSIDTGNRQRDADVLAPEFLDVAHHPTLTFRSTSISALADEGSYAIVGDVTIGGVTQPLTLHAEFGGSQSSTAPATPASKPSPTCAAKTSASASTSPAPCSATSSRSNSTSSCSSRSHLTSPDTTDPPATRPLRIRYVVEASPLVPSPRELAGPNRHQLPGSDVRTPAVTTADRAVSRGRTPTAKEQP